MNPEKLVISPGPSNPDNAGISNEAIWEFSGKIPILGVCLGHQCIGQTFGARVEYAGEVKHGKTSMVNHNGLGVFKGIENPVEVVRYHSLSINPESVPDNLEVSATTENGVIMGIRHKKYPIEGVQFHPESILTKHGKLFLKNFLEY